MFFLQKKLLIIFMVVGITACASAQNNAGAVTVAIKVNNDRSGIIEAAFAKALLDQGIQVSKDDAPYTLDVDIIIAEIPSSMALAHYARISLLSKLTDHDTILLPYVFNIREGGSTADGAEQRAYDAAVRKIAEEYGEQAAAAFKKK